MEKKNLIGYIVFGIGALLFLLSYPSIRALLKIKLPSGIPDLAVMIIGVAVIFIGAYFGFSRSNTPKQISEEVPIYHGKHIVGYRKEKK
jgi:multisubunit Na+/H+ antiporter MnhB subunit